MINNNGSEDLEVSYQNFSWDAIKKVVSLVEDSKGYVAGMEVSISFSEFFNIGKLPLDVRNEWKKEMCAQKAASERRKIGASLEGLKYDLDTKDFNVKLLYWTVKAKEKLLPQAQPSSSSSSLKIQQPYSEQSGGFKRNYWNPVNIKLAELKETIIEVAEGAERADMLIEQLKEKCANELHFLSFTEEEDARRELVGSLKIFFTMLKVEGKDGKGPSRA